MKVEIRSMLKFYTILLLNDGPKHGYELMKELEKKVGKNVSTSQVYPFLNTLKKEGYIVTERVGVRDKKIYKLTADGKKFINKLINRFGELIRFAIEPKLTNCAHCGCKIYEGGHKETIKGKKVLFCCPHCAMNYKKLK